MRAATIVDKGIVIQEHPDPTPGHGQLLVRVRAAGLNNADLIQQQGGYPAPPDAPADIPGLEFAGEVVTVGPGVVRFAPGDRVMAVVGGGAQAELVLVHERHAMTVPEGVAWETAGAFPEAFMTAHDALFTQCGLTVGDRLLVHGGAGGVGTAAIQLGAAAGAHVMATVRNPDLRVAVSQLGATVIAPENFAGHGPYDIVLELIGGPNMDENIQALDTGGRVAIIGVGAGGMAEINLRLLMAKRATMVASTIRTRSLEQKAELARRLEAHVLPLLAAGRITVPVTATFPLDEAAAAYDRFAAGGKLGKIVLVMDGAA